MTLSEFDMLKAQADQMGITYKANIGLETLRSRVKARLENDDEPTDGDEDDVSDALEVKQPAKSALSKDQIMQAERTKQHREQMALVRVRIACLNPAKATVPGEILTVANKYVGTVRKYIPFGEATDNGYHVPRILLNELKSRKFNSIKTRKGDKGAIEVTQRLVPEFSIEELEPLTKEELAKLAAQQMAAAGL